MRIDTATATHQIKLFIMIRLVFASVKSNYKDQLPFIIFPLTYLLIRSKQMISIDQGLLTLLWNHSIFLLVYLEFSQLFNLHALM